MQEELLRPEIDRLTIRELEVLRLIGDGSSDREIAQVIFRQGTFGLLPRYAATPRKEVHDN